ncbi:MAG: ATP-binding protein [Phycisphaerae bacterium]
MARRIADFDWSSTPLGPIDQWPQSLRIAVSIVLNSRFPMFVWWGPALINIYNDGYIPMLGKRHPTALGRPARDSWNDIWDVVGAQADLVMNHGQATWNDRVKLVMERHGYWEDTWFTWSYSPILDESGKIGGLFCAVTEETQRVRAEMENKRLASHIEIALDAANLGWWHYDPVTDITVWDERFRRIFGMQDLSGNNREPLGRIHPDDHPRVRAAVEAALNPANPRPYHAEYRICRDDGERWIEAHGEATFTGDNGERRAVSFVGTVADVTARKHAEALPRIILESITDAFFALDADWNFTFLNPQAEQVLERQPGELIGQNIWKVYPGLTGSDFETAYRSTAADRAPRSVTAFYPDHNRWYEVHVYPAPSGISVYFRNVTDRKIAEAALQQSEARARFLVALDDALRPITDPNEISKTASRLLTAFLNADGGSYVEVAPDQDHCSVTVAFTPKSPPLIGDYRVSDFGAEYHATVLANRPYVENDTTRTDLPPDVRARYAAVNFGAFIGAPLFKEGRLAALFVVFTTGPRNWLPQESEIVTLVAGRCWESIERARIALALRDREARAQFFVQLDDALRNLSDPDEISRTAARLLTEFLAAHSACYVEVDADQDHCTVTGEFRPDSSSLIGTYRFSEYGAEYHAAVLANRPFAENDTQRTSLAPEERARYAAIDVGAFIAGPLFKFGRLTAMVCVYSRPARAWTPAEIEVVTLVASRCWESIERARVARALKASEERLSLSIESAELGTFYCPMPLGKINWNAKCKEHFWLPPHAEVDFDLFYSRLHPDDRERTRLAVERTIFHGEPYDIQYRTVSPDGRTRWVRAKGHAYYDEYGAPLRFDGITIDITEAKAAEKRRDQLLDAERAAREEAERVSRMKDEFLATLSHELRTPLNAILGWSQILSRGPIDPEDLRDGLDTIARNARSQAQIIEDLLDMSRIISGKVRLNLQQVSLAGIAEQAIQSVRPSAETKGLHLSSDIQPGATTISGDPGRLQQVVWNLLTNALKFTPRDGDVHLRIRTIGSQVELSVTDTGEGIDPAFLPHVFERFRQADASTTRKHGGLGLGLSIVKQLTELHGGTVTVSSPGKGHGSTFTILLPLATAAAIQPAAEDPSPHAIPISVPDLHLPSLKGIDILVVDDDADARDLMRRLLTEHGAAVTLAESATRALDLLRSRPPSILVSDIGMPGEDGYDLIRKVRALPHHQGGNTPAVALTAFARSEDRQQALRAGFQIHVPKPVDPTELLTVCATLANTPT